MPTPLWKPENPDATIHTATDPVFDPIAKAQDDDLAAQQAALKAQPWHIEQYGTVTITRRQAFTAQREKG